MEDHETRRKIIRQWMALSKDKGQSAYQAAAFVKRAVEQNKFQRSSRLVCGSQRLTNNRDLGVHALVQNRKLRVVNR